MATEMKLLLALLLLACICTVHGERGARKKNPCTQGMAALEVFMEYRGCKGPEPRRILMELMYSLQDNFTMETLDYLFTNYCSTALPSMVQCFEGNILNCSAQQQHYLKTVAQQTGFLCQPNSASVNPVIRHILTQLSNADLAENQECYNVDPEDIEDRCYNQSMEAIGLSPGEDRLGRSLQNLTMEQLAPKLQMFVRTYVSCAVTQIRDHPNRCPEWRGLALRGVRHVLNPLLGVNMTFTNEEVDRMFDWESPTEESPTEESPTEESPTEESPIQSHNSAAPGRLYIELSL